jgi:hypothetical protein
VILKDTGEEIVTASRFPVHDAVSALLDWGAEVGDTLEVFREDGCACRAHLWETLDWFRRRPLGPYDSARRPIVGLIPAKHRTVIPECRDPRRLELRRKRQQPPH